ncbi:MAG TPA: anti-sigma factor [Solirubrobacteraceae bacterium]|jgi:hypothetical protein|nr:anti-sigma factor [Solirubrobacteraceae bacterium]
MNVEGHEHFEGEVAAYVMRALPDDDVPALEGHLAECAVCRADVVSLQQAVDSLPASTAPMEAPLALGQRIMATVRSEADLLRAAGAGADAVPARRPRRRWTGLSLSPAGALAGLSALAAGVAIGAVALGGGASPTPPRVASVDSAALPGATASVRRTSYGVELQVDHMAAPPRGRVYEVWLARRGQAPQPSSLFEISSGSVRVSADMRGVTSVMVTSEPAGGSQVPSRQPVIVARPA